jgi:hypothetical protein
MLAGVDSPEDTEVDDERDTRELGSSNDSVWLFLFGVIIFRTSALIACTDESSICLYCNII